MIGMSVVSKGAVNHRVGNAVQNGLTDDLDQHLDLDLDLYPFPVQNLNSDVIVVMKQQINNKSGETESELQVKYKH